MTKGTETVLAIWETTNAIQIEDSFEATIITITEAEAIKLTANVATLAEVIR